MLRRKACGFESHLSHHKRTQRLFQSQKVGRAKRVPLISPHFSKRIWSTAFGGTDCFFAKKQVRAKDFFCELRNAICYNNHDIEGVIVADAGYVSRDMEENMFIEGKRWVLVKPYKTMKKLCTKWQAKLYNSRFATLFDFRSLKLFHGLVTSMPRTVNGYIANYLHAILSFVIA